MHCAIWYHLYNLKNVKNTHGGLTLVKLQASQASQIRKRGDLSADNIKYSMVKDLKFAQFYLLLKIYKRLENVPGRTVISNCGFCTEIFQLF